MTSRSEVRAFLLAVILQCYRPRPTGSVWQWAEAEVVLSRTQSPGKPGPYTAIPYTRESHDFINDPDWDEEIVQKSSQSSFTETTLNAIRYCVANRPTSVLYVVDTREEAKKVLRTRLEPSLDKFVPSELRDTVEEDDMQSMVLYLPHMTISVAGGHAGGALAGKPIGLGIIDEANEHPAPAPGEMKNTDKLRERVKTIPDKKIYIIGRPTDELGLITEEYKTGTQSKRHWHCPDCGHAQELVLEGLRFDHCKDLLGEWDLHRVLKETFYGCAKCYDPTKPMEERKGIIRDEDKYNLDDKGIWVITNPKHVPRRRSKHISDLYSPFVTFGQLAVEFLQASMSGDIAKLRAFWTGRLGLPFRQQGAEITEGDVGKCRGEYPRGECPFTQEETCLIAVTTDKQADVFKSIKTAFKKTGELAVIDYKICLAEEELVEWAHEPVIRFGGVACPAMAPKLALIDEGYQAKISVRDFILRNEGFYFGSKGRGGIQVKATVAQSKTPHDGRELIIYHYDDDEFKRQLYINRIAKLDDIISGRSRVPRLWLPKNIDYDFAKELWAERLEEEKPKWGPSKWIWKMTGPANDFGDALKMHLVIWYIVGHALQEEQDGVATETETEEPAAA